MKTGGQETTMAIGGDTAAGGTPLSAWTVKVEVPAVVGVPEQRARDRIESELGRQRPARYEIQESWRRIAGGRGRIGGGPEPSTVAAVEGVSAVKAGGNVSVGGVAGPGLANDHAK